MALEIVLYNNFSDNRTVNKSITEVMRGNIYLYEDSSIVNPVVRLDYDATILPAVNYAFVSAWNRYYYITDISALVGGGMRIAMSCDVLMTYKGTILNSTQTVIRNEGIGKPTMIPDPTLPVLPSRDIKVIQFEGGDFNLDSATSHSYNFVLNVSGGGSGQQVRSAEQKGEMNGT